MGNKSKSSPPAQPPVPPPADCAHDPETPEASNDLLGLNLSSLVGTVSKLAHDVGGGELLGGAGNSATASAGDGSSGVSIHVGTSGDDGGKPLLSLHSGSDAELIVPVFGEGGVFAAGAEGGSGPADVGSLLNLAMLKVGSAGALGAISGGDVYDGNVPLAGDLSSALGSTLDLLTTTTSLFDVPVLDIGGCDTLDG